jgi:hypothetical protein
LSKTFSQIFRAAAAVCALAAMGETAVAQQKIGSAAAVVNDVSRELAGAAGPLKAGDSVIRNEIVRTAAASKAKLIFLDSTNLVIGPASEMTLDEFVYSGPTAPASTQKMEVGLTRGVFRFTAGTLDKKAYLITTTVASIGVEGTVLDIDVRSALTRVTLVEGRVLVCPRRSGVSFEQQRRNCERPANAGQSSCECVELGAPGQTAEVKAAVHGVNHASRSSTPVDFAPVCAGTATSFCSVQQFASAVQATGFPRGALCGH